MSSSGSAGTHIPGVVLRWKTDMGLEKALGLGRFMVNKSSHWTREDGSTWWHNPATDTIEPYSPSDAPGRTKEGSNGVFDNLPQSFPPVPKGKRIAYGGIVLDEGGEHILMRKVAGSYGGYVWTYAKGGQDANEKPEDTASREVLEELGIQGKIHGTLPAWYEGDTSATAFFIMQAQGKPVTPDKETEVTRWIPLKEAEDYIGMTTTQRGKQRDLKVLSDIRILIGKEEHEAQ